MTKLNENTLNKKVRTIAFPAMIGFLFSTLFNVVDNYFAGQIGTDAISGMTLAFPVFMLLLSLASGMGNGLNALAAIAIGENNRQKFHKLFKNSLLIALVFSVLVPFIAPSIARMIFHLQGASDEAIHFGLRYIATVMVGFVFFMVNFTLNGVLYAQGNTKPFRNFLIVASVLNVILNPLLIHGFLFVPGLDTMGIALATIIVQALGSVYLLRKVQRSTWGNFKEALNVKIDYQTIKALLYQGIPSSLNTATIALGIFVINYYVQLYGGNETLAGYGIAIRIEQLALVPTLGINVAVVTLVGQSFGAKKFDLIYKIWMRSTVFGLGIMGLGLIFIFPFAPFLIGFFDQNNEVIEAGSRYLRIEAIAFLSYVLLNISISMLQGIKKPVFALWIGLYRQLLPLGLFYLLGTILSMGIDGVWWGIVIINWTAVIITLFYSTVTLSKVSNRYKA